MLSPPVDVATSAPEPRCLTCSASANVITACVARASTIGTASTSRVRSDAADGIGACKDTRVAKVAKEILLLDGHEVTVSNPEKIYFPEAGITKLELVQYYLAVADGALRGVARRPMILKRFVN